MTLSVMTRASRHARIALLAAVAASCSNDVTGSSAPSPASLSVVSGSGQTGAVGAVLPAPITVSVGSTSGTPVVGVAVTFLVTVGSATVSPATAVTNTFGEATSQLTLGNSTGAVEVTAAVAGTTLTAKIQATASTPEESDCSTNALALPLVGGVSVGLAGTALCAPGGTAGAEYVLVPFNGSATPLATAAVSVTPAGILSTASVASVASGFAPLGAFGVSASLSVNTFSAPANDFHARLRASEAALSPRISSARRWQADRRRAAASGASLSVIPSQPAVGQLLTLNANGEDACDVPKTRGGRIVAVTARAIVVADTGNPAGGFTDAEYESMGVTFDTLVDPIDRAAFGDPTDIDGNGRVLLFFTREVNALTPRDGDGSYVAGFFYARDLFPATSTSSADGCATSNVGEMFYVLAPDPTGTVNGNVFTKSQVSTISRGVIAHEYQHLINAARRMYVNASATDFEEGWLNEGLSHVAEELLFYGETGLKARQNLDVTAIRTSSRYVSAFNEDMLSNFGRYAEYLDAPSVNSPYADDDELATRGATWSFLRYAADQSSTSSATDASIWQQLVNSSATGRANLQQVFGGALTTLFRDWTTSLVADDVSGAPAAYQQASWNFRSIYSVLQKSGGYPLTTVSLASGVPSTVRLSGGSAAYLTFGVPAGGTATIRWGTLPANVQFTLIRTR